MGGARAPSPHRHLPLRAGPGGIPRVFAELVEGGSLSDWIADGRLYAGNPDAALARLLDVAIGFAWGLGYLLRAERLRLGLSQVALGAWVGVSPETIRKYEAGGRTPARATLVRLVAALQLSAVHLPVSEGHRLVAALPPPASAPSVSD